MKRPAFLPYVYRQKNGLIQKPSAGETVPYRIARCIVFESLWVCNIWGAFPHTADVTSNAVAYTPVRNYQVV